MSEQTIGADKVATIHYTLTNEAGKVLDSSRGGSPMAYLHGHGNIVPGLENRLLGAKVGDAFAAVVPPAEGYGEKQGEPQSVFRREFPKEMTLQEGMPLRATNSQGEDVVLWIHGIKGDRVFVHTDHPLAGETLRFDVEVMEIRDASAEEIAHGHVHGPHGHHH